MRESAGGKGSPAVVGPRNPRRGRGCTGRPCTAEGMSLIVLHSDHQSELFRRLKGTICKLSWREQREGELERGWAVSPSHPIAEGLPRISRLRIRRCMVSLPTYGHQTTCCSCLGSRAAKSFAAGACSNAVETGFPTSGRSMKHSRSTAIPMFSVSKPTSPAGQDSHAATHQRTTHGNLASGPSHRTRAGDCAPLAMTASLK